MTEFLEKVDEYQRSRYSITSVFKFSGPLSIERRTRDAVVQSFRMQSCGMGWHFFGLYALITRGKENANFSVKCYPGTTDSQYYPLTMTLSLSMELQSGSLQTPRLYHKTISSGASPIEIAGFTAKISEIYRFSFTATSSVPMTLPNALTSPSDIIADFRLIRSTLNKTIISGAAFVDIKFYVFSRRSHSGRVSSPLPIFANSSLLQGVIDEQCWSYFKSLDGFSESSITELGAPFPEGAQMCIDDYDYESDSDLEDGMDDEDGDDFSAGAGRLETAPGIGMGCTVFVKDAAFKTWKALILYFYTGEMVFAPLKSQKLVLENSTSGHRGNQDVPHRDNNPEQCSPKSIYRLADKLGLLELESRAFKAIRSRLSEDNIVDETFSRFTSRYDKIKQIEIDFLLLHHASSKVSDGLAKTIETVTLGELPHCSQILTTIMQRMSAKAVAAS